MSDRSPHLCNNQIPEPGKIYLTKQGIQLGFIVQRPHTQERLEGFIYINLPTLTAESLVQLKPEILEKIRETVPLPSYNNRGALAVLSNGLLASNAHDSVYILDPTTDTCIDEFRTPAGASTLKVLSNGQLAIESPNGLHIWDVSELNHAPVPKNDVEEKERQEACCIM
jgi:hypothetical protein